MRKKSNNKQTGWKEKLNEEKSDLPPGWKGERNEIRKEFRKEKLRITRKYMIERRRSRWLRNMNWVEDNVKKLIDIKDANPEDVQDFEVPLVIVGSDVARVVKSRASWHPGCSEVLNLGQSVQQNSYKIMRIVQNQCVKHAIWSEVFAQKAYDAAKSNIYATLPLGATPKRGF